MAHPAAGDRTWTTSYNANGLPVLEQLPGSVSRTKTYDNLNRLTAETGTGATTTARTLDHDPLGRITSASSSAGNHTYTWTDNGSLKTATGYGGTATFTYDGEGLLTRRDDAAGTADFTYDGAGRLATVDDPLNATQATYGYDEAGRVKTINQGGSNSIRTYVYDDYGRTQSDTVTPSVGTPTSTKTEYEYDLDDLLTAKTTAGVTGAGLNQYTHDGLSRITSWLNPGGQTTTYGYDAASNRTSVTTSAGTRTSTYDARNRITATTGAGGPADSYTWNPRGQLTGSVQNGQSTTYTYDAFERLTQVTGSSTPSTTYGYDSLDRVAQRNLSNFGYNDLSNNPVVSPAAAGETKLLRDPLGAALASKTGSSAAALLLDDPLHGDITAATNSTTGAASASASFDPWGVSTSSGPVPLGYQGGYTDPDTGLTNAHARWYNPTLGSFTSRDTWTLVPKPVAQANRYLYANGSPLNGRDSNGHSFDPGYGEGGGSTPQPAPTPPPVSICNNPSHPEWCPGTPVYTPPDHPTPIYTPPTPPPWDDPAYLDDPTANCNYENAYARDACLYSTGQNVILPEAGLGMEFVDEWRPGDGISNPLDFIEAFFGTPIDQLDSGAISMAMKAWFCYHNKQICADMRAKAWEATWKGLLGITAFNECKDAITGGENGNWWGCAETAVNILSIAVPFGKAAVAFKETLALRATGSAFAKDIGIGCLTPNSFNPDTQVLMADGTTKSIASIVPGDSVIASDPVTSVTAAATVSATHRHDDIELADVTVRDDTGMVLTIHATADHPFWNRTDHAWQSAKSLTAGDELASTGDRTVTVVGVDTLIGDQEMHNLTVADIHTYYVIAGNTPVLVHNCNTPAGFAGKGEYNEFVGTMNNGLSGAGYSGTQAVFQGSSVTGRSFVSGRPFGAHSDYDIALGGQDIFARAQELGIPLRSGGTRTGPLKPGQLDALGLSDMRAQLQGMAGRPVNFMIYDSIDGAMARSPSLLAVLCGC